jgi:osmotically-inducible protein OsmY
MATGFAPRSSSDARDSRSILNKSPFLVFDCNSGAKSVATKKESRVGVAIMKTDEHIQEDVLDELAFDDEVKVTDVGVEVDDGVVTCTAPGTRETDFWAAVRW